MNTNISIKLSLYCMYYRYSSYTIESIGTLTKWTIETLRQNGMISKKV